MRRGVDIDEYPAIKNYLSTYRERLEPRPKEYKGKEWKGRKVGTYKWYELQDAVDYYEEFSKPKIMYQKFQVKPAFIYDEQGLYCNDSMWIITKADKGLFAVLNSKMGWYLISKYCTAIQNGYQLIFQYFGQIPIPASLSQSQPELVNKVDQILIAKAIDPTADTSALEAEIDRMVYALYGLTEEEIAIVEG